MSFRKTQIKNYIVYTFAFVWLLGIILSTFLIDFTFSKWSDAFIGISELVITVWIFIIAERLISSGSYKQSARQALKEIISYSPYQLKLEPYDAKNPNSPLQLLIDRKRRSALMEVPKLENGEMDLRIGFGVLENFDIIISPTDLEKDNKVEKFRSLIKDEITKYLQENTGSLNYHIEPRTEGVYLKVFEHRVNPKEYKRIISGLGIRVIDFLTNSDVSLIE